MKSKKSKIKNLLSTPSIKLSNYLSISLLSLLPAVSFAAYGVPAPTTPQSVNDIFTNFSEGNIMGFFPAIIIAGVVTFLAGVVKYVTADDEEKKEGGRQVIVFGLIVLFIMVSSWAFVKIIYGSFFTDEPGIPNYLPTPFK